MGEQANLPEEEAEHLVAEAIQTVRQEQRQRQAEQEQES